ncbi:MAG: proton glutamate symport protein [Bradymonadia bacterium]|jgi:proton glutamate symport protein
MVAALVLGSVAKSMGYGADAAWLQPVDFVGQMFLRLLKMIIVPLVFASVITGVSSIDVNKLGALGGKTLLYYTTSTAAAVVLGLFAVNLVKPGDGVSIETDYVPPVEPTGFAEVFLNIVPTNPFASLAAEYHLLGVISFGIFLAVAISSVGEDAKPLRRFFVSLEAVMMWIVDVVMKLAPVGIFALLLTLVVETGAGIVGDLAKYMATVVGALGIHAVVTLPLLVMLVGRISPLKLVRALSPALLTAFSTASSAATLPVTMDSLENRAGVDPTVSGFVLPLGATVNMDGTALYEAVAAIFIAQAFGIDLTLGAQVLVFVTATLAAIGAAGVPSAGLVTMIIVLEAVGLPIEGIGLLVAVDRILDMTRTTVNVWGDACGAAIIASRDGMLNREILDAP